MANHMHIAMTRRRRLFPAAAQEESDLISAGPSWCWHRYNREQPWSACVDPGKGSSLRSFKKIANHLPSNQDAFRGNYGVLLLHTLDFKVTGNWTLVEGIAAAVLVCTAFSLHEEEDKATFWGTETAMLGGKNHKLVVVAALALLLLYVVTFGPQSRGL
ncbi:hypothetical protein MRX96_025938 [Rhipicephalus microplus]